MNKKVKVFLFFYAFQFMISSCVNCHCNSANYEKIYNAIEVKAWDTSGFQNSEIINSTPVYKNSFGLSISVLSKLNEVAFNKIKWRSLGFESTYACDCPGDTYNIDDPIDSIMIAVIDVNTQNEIDVTSKFAAKLSNGNEITLNELFENLEDWQDGFQFDLKTYDDIPGVAIFKVKIYLESGIELTEQTQQINFEE